MISNYVTSLIRTYVPLGVGVLVSWLASLGITVSDSAQTALVAGLGALAAAVYYALVRLLENRWPWFGRLLGKPTAPKYIDESGTPVPAPVTEPAPVADPAAKE